MCILLQPVLLLDMCVLRPPCICVCSTAYLLGLNNKKFINNKSSIHWAEIWTMWQKNKNCIWFGKETEKQQKFWQWQWARPWARVRFPTWTEKILNLNEPRSENRQWGDICPNASGDEWNSLLSTTLRWSHSPLKFGVKKEQNRCTKVTYTGLH